MMTCRSQKRKYHLPFQSPTAHLKNELCWFYFGKSKYDTFYITFQRCDGAGGWNPSPWREGKKPFINIVNTMATDGLATEGARTSVAMVLTKLSRNIPVKGTEGFQYTIHN